MYLDEIKSLDLVVSPHAKVRVIGQTLCLMMTRNMFRLGRAQGKHQQPLSFVFAKLIFTLSLLVIIYWGRISYFLK